MIEITGQTINLAFIGYYILKVEKKIRRLIYVQPVDNN